MGLRNARELSSAQNNVQRLLKSSAFGGNEFDDTLEEMKKRLASRGRITIIDEVGEMTPEAIIASAGSIGYYAKKFGVK